MRRIAAFFAALAREIDRLPLWLVVYSANPALGAFLMIEEDEKKRRTEKRR